MNGATNGQSAPRTALVTGASRGLGRVIAERLWSLGMNLVLVGRDARTLDHVVGELPSRDGGRALAVAVDLADPSAGLAIARRTSETFDGVDAVVHNAAVQGPIGPLETTDSDEWQRAVQVNLLAPAALTRACLPLMRSRRGRGKIVFISGGGATGPRPRFSAYATAKAGLVRLAETLAEELRPDGIDVNCVAPGAMRSAMTDAVLAAGAEQAGDREFRDAERIRAEAAKVIDRAADLCAFLVSSGSDGITGKLISAVWDPWEELPSRLADLRASDVYTLRRIVPKDRGLGWG